jgi:hypothetical protein
LLLCLTLQAQVARDEDPSPPQKQSPVTTGSVGAEERQSTDARFKRLPKNILDDQIRILRSPARLRLESLRWAIPLTFATAFSFGADTEIQAKVAGRSLSSRNRATSLSNVGIATFSSVAAAQYFWGKHLQNERLRETGFLSGEAALDSLLLTTGIKTVANRQRPPEGKGLFFEGASRLNSSFPSQHSAVAWSIASVMVHEYPGRLTELLAYGGASAIGIARVAGNNHFASDVLIGSAIGYFTGQEVYIGHSHDTNEIGSYGTFEKVRDSEQRYDSSMLGSSYVPLDSWVYESFDRLNALGLIPDGISGNRPWTRKHCAQLLQNISEEELKDDRDAGFRVDDSALQLSRKLRVEFGHELSLLEGTKNVAAGITSVYSRTAAIARSPLNDALHFGQTIVNDFGRPYGAGVNEVAGLDAHAEAGPLAIYIRGELQRSPTADEYTLSTRNAIASVDGLPVQPGNTVASITRFTLLDSYVALNVRDWQLSFGKESMSWGPGRSTGLTMSTNASPMTMLKLSTAAPKRLPILGTFASTTFIAKLDGYRFLRLGPSFELTGSWESRIDPQPYIWGELMSFKPTKNFEFGVGLTTIWAGLGRPATLDTFRHTFSTKGNVQPIEPGDRRTDFYFSYRIPGIRDWLTLYAEGMAEDEPLPLLYPRRSAWNPGLYLPKFPKLNKMDLRVEAVYTDLPNLRITGYFYINGHYANGYTNNGNIIGSWIGPQGRGVTVDSNYWFSPRNRLRVGYRYQRVNSAYLSGGRLDDYSGRYTFLLRSALQVTAALQQEHWTFPAIAAKAKNNTSVSVELKLELPGFKK